MAYARYPYFVDGSYQAQAITAAADECINLYVEVVGPHGKNDRYLTKAPGRKVLLTIPDPPVRGLFAGDDVLYVAGFGTLYEVQSPGGNLQINAVGTFERAVTPVKMFANGTQLFFCSGDKGYCATGDRTVVEVVSGVMASYQDGYFIAQQPNSNQFNLSALEDGQNWDPLEYATKSGGADRLMAIQADHEMLWLLGQKTSEVWYDSGAALFPYQRIQGAFIEQGVVAPWSVAQLDNSLFWLGGDDRGVGIVWRTQGFAPVRVSNHAVEAQWLEYADMSDAWAYSYQENGHSFYVLNFPAGNATWVYDCASGMWHRRGVWNPNKSAYDIDPCWTHAYVEGGGYNMHIVGDSRNGNLYQQSTSIYDDAANLNGPKNSNLLRWQRTCPHLDNMQRWTYFQRLRLEMLVGGSSLGRPQDDMRIAGQVPQFKMCISDDGGFNFTDPMLGSLGALGKYKTVVEWRQLGRSRDRVHQVYGSDPVQIAIVDAYLDALPEPEAN